MSANRISELENELGHFKELYEIEKETNELNEMKIKELDLMNSQDKQTFDLERNRLKADVRRLEMEKDRKRDDDSASAFLKQKVHQLERDVTTLNERVRIAENTATKMEDQCRSKDFDYSELQKQYELCLGRCNALELQLMSVSMNYEQHASHSMSSSVLSLNNEETKVPKEEAIQENNVLTPIPSPPVPSSSSSTTSNPCQENQNPDNVDHFVEFKDHLTKRFGNDGDGLTVLKDIDLNKARSYCESNPNDVEALLEFADLIRSIRAQSMQSTKPGLDRRSAPSPSRIPRAVQLGMESIKRVRRPLEPLAKPPSPAVQSTPAKPTKPTLTKPINRPAKPTNPRTPVQTHKKP